MIERESVEGKIFFSAHILLIPYINLQLNIRVHTFQYYFFRKPNIMP